MASAVDDSNPFHRVLVWFLVSVVGAASSAVWLLSSKLQGDHYTCAKPPVDIKTTGGFAQVE